MSIIIFLVILVILILVHEFGHFIVAKKFGIRVDEFGIGFPPKLMGKKFGETEYTVNVLPFGGFVRIFGEDPNDESIHGEDKARSFVHKSKYIQSAVLLAGVFFNILLAWLLFSVNFMIGMPATAENDLNRVIVNPVLTVVEIVPDSPAFEAGIIPGSVVTSLSANGDSVEPTTHEEFSGFILSHPNQAITVSYTAGKTEEKTVVIEPELGIVEGVPAIGVALDTVGTLRLPPHIALWEGLRLTVNATGAVAVGLYGFFADAFTGQADFSQVAGPVGIVGIVGDAAGFGIVSLFGLMAIISINLAIINVLPFPALDGGRLLFVIIEAIKGSPIKPSVANILNATGFALLILLMLIVTWSDTAKLLGS